MSPRAIWSIGCGQLVNWGVYAFGVLGPLEHHMPSLARGWSVRSASGLCDRGSVGGRLADQARTCCDQPVASLQRLCAWAMVRRSG
jgi:hypothetical protein